MQAEIEALAAAVGLPVEEFQRRYVRTVGIRKSLVEFANGDCVFFDGASRRCRVYEARPRQCRTWPFWASNLATPAAWEETAERCPGLQPRPPRAAGKDRGATTAGTPGCGITALPPIVQTHRDSSQ